ncbi:MAG: exodeoxyribonuclease V subunit gamma [Candidatus Brocadia sp.]|jgi:ATP-dependent helicase/DNAse subunit B
MLSVKIGNYHPSLEGSFAETIQALKREDPLIPLVVVAPTNWMIHRLQERLARRYDASLMNLSFMNFYAFAKEICRRSETDVGQIIQQPVVYEGIITGLLKQYIAAFYNQIPPHYEEGNKWEVKNSPKKNFLTVEHHPIYDSLFKNVQSLPAIAKSLFQVIQDLIDANVHIDDLKAAIQEGFVEGAEAQKLSGVIHLYDLFQQKLKAMKIFHYADVFRTATACVQDSEFLSGFRYILAYGFYDLTGVEQDFFGEIFRTYPTILFLPYQKKHPAFTYVKPFFESFVLGVASDVEELSPESVTGFSYLMDPKTEHESIAGCESRVIGYRLNAQPTTQNPQPIIINASGKRDEVWIVVKEILRLVDEGYKMEEIGVVARSLELYTDTIKKIFQENNIPFVTSTQEPLGRYPLVKVIQQILLLKREDFYRPIVIELLGSPYFKIPLPSHKEVAPRPDLWDILSRRLGIRSGITCWLSRLEQAKVMTSEFVDLNTEKYVSKAETNTDENTFPYEVGGRGGENMSPNDEETGRHIHIPAVQIEFLEDIMRTLSNDLSLLPEKASWSVMCQKISHFLRNYIHIPSEGMDPEDTERDLLILDKIWELLNSLRILNCLGEEVTVEQFVDTFINAYRQESLPIGLGNGRGVKVLDAMSARGIPFRALFVLGLNEKTFPRVISEEPFLRDHVRRKLSEVLGNFIPEKLRGFDEERLLFYFLLNAAGERLYLLHERSDEAGKPKVQSHYLIDILQNMRGTSSPEKDLRGKPEYEIYVPRGIKEKLCRLEVSLLTPKEAGIRMALGRIDPASFINVFGINRNAFKRSQSALEFIESYNHSLTPYDGIVGDISKWWNGYTCRGLNPTTLEVFGTCPFKFFMSRILELESLEEPEIAEMIAAVDIGILYHGILRNFYSTLIEKGYFATKTKEINPTELLHNVARRYFSEIEKQIPIPYPAIWEIEKEEMLNLLTRFITWDLEQIEQTGYVPVYLEKTVRLSPQNDSHKLIPEHFKQGDSSRIAFKGKIDRIDLKKEENTVSFRVVDYKSGRLLKDNLVKSAIRGQRLQLPFYIIMTEHLLSEEIRKGLLPKGQARLDEASFVYVAEDEGKKGLLRPPKKTIDSNDWRECREQYWETLREFLQIIRAGIFPASPAEDSRRCEWCEFATTCRRSHQPFRFRLEQDARLKKYREIVNLNMRKKPAKS